MPPEHNWTCPEGQWRQNNGWVLEFNTRLVREGVPVRRDAMNRVMNTEGRGRFSHVARNYYGGDSIIEPGHVQRHSRRNSLRHSLGGKSSQHRQICAPLPGIIVVFMSSSTVTKIRRASSAWSNVDGIFHDHRYELRFILDGKGH